MPISAHVKRFSVFRTRDFYCIGPTYKWIKQGPTRHRPMAHPVGFRYLAINNQKHFLYLQTSTNWCRRPLSCPQGRKMTLRYLSYSTTLAEHAVHRLWWHFIFLHFLIILGFWSFDFYGFFWDFEIFPLFLVLFWIFFKVRGCSHFFFFLCFISDPSYNYS